MQFKLKISFKKSQKNLKNEHSRVIFCYDLVDFHVLNLRSNLPLWPHPIFLAISSPLFVYPDEIVHHVPY